MKPMPQPEPELDEPRPELGSWVEAESGRERQRDTESWVCPDCEQENDCTDAACIACDVVRRPTAGWLPVQVDSEAYLFQRVLPPALCSQLIRMSHERTFSLDLEHVDDKPVHTPY